MVFVDRLIPAFVDGPFILWILLFVAAPLSAVQFLCSAFWLLGLWKFVWLSLPLEVLVQRNHLKQVCDSRICSAVSPLFLLGDVL